MVGVGLGLLLLVVLVAKSAGKARANGRWQAAATELGLEVSPGPGFRVSGRGLTVVGTPTEGMTYEFGGLPRNLSIGRQGSATNGNESRKSVSVGDDLFDARVDVRGAEEDVVALLDSATRRALVDFAGSGGTAAWGKLRLSPPEDERDPEQLAENARWMIALGEHLAQPERRKLLLTNATNDPASSVRARNLEVLAAKFRDSEEARQAAQAGLDDRFAAVRLVAADIERGEKSMAVLRGMVADARVEPQLRAAALERLVEIVGYARVIDLVAGALEQPEPFLRRAAAVAAGDAHDLDQVDRLCGPLRDEPPWLIEAVVSALGKLGDSRAEPTLIAVLGHPDDSVKTAAARVLGVLGTVDAVDPLLPLTKGLMQTGLHAAARDAVRRIQERLGDVEAGRLSVVAESPAGALSTSPAADGELSLPDRVKE